MQVKIESSEYFGDEMKSFPPLFFALLILLVPYSTVHAQIGNLLNCPTSTIFGSNEPEQVHISLTDIANQMQVSWATEAQTDSVVEWGQDGDLGSSATGDSFCYDHDMVFHTATMDGLSEDSIYSYRVGDGDSMSEVFTFQTRNSSGVVDFIAFGDHGLSDEGMTTTDLITDSDVDFVLLSGDISYANGEQSVWDDYMSYNEKSMSRTPWMMAPGNHENETGYGFSAYETRFEFPSQGGNDLYHHFTVGAVQVIQFSTEHDFTSGSEQYNWLEGRLQNANALRSEFPWIVISAHKPMYTSHGSDTHDIDVQLRDALEAMFVENNVNLVVWGHDHFYERTWPVYDEEVSSRGDPGDETVFSGDNHPIHIVAGTGGRGEYEFQDDQPDWSAYRENSYGFLRINADFESMKVEYHRQDGSIGDSFTFRQGTPIPAVEEESSFLFAPSAILTLLMFLCAAILLPRWNTDSQTID